MNDHQGRVLLLTGAPGSGKTTIMKKVAAGLSGKRICGLVEARFFFPAASAESRRHGRAPSGPDRHDLQLNHRLLRAHLRPLLFCLSA